MTRSIVLTICEQHRIRPEEFFGKSRCQKLSACRRDAILALYEAGFSVSGCARMIRRNVSTVHYWLKPANRDHRKKSMLARKSWKRNCMDTSIQQFHPHAPSNTLS